MQYSHDTYSWHNNKNVWMHNSKINAMHGLGIGRQVMRSVLSL